MRSCKAILMAAAGTGGRIEPDEFEEGLLSEQEKANISMIQSRQ